MLFVNLVPIGLYQLFDSYENGYWHARSAEFFMRPEFRFREWLRLPGDLLFIVGGILPLVYLAIRMFRHRNGYRQLTPGQRPEMLTQLVSNRVAHAMVAQIHHKR